MLISPVTPRIPARRLSNLVDIVETRMTARFIFKSDHIKPLRVVLAYLSLLVQRSYFLIFKVLQLNAVKIGCYSFLIFIFAP